MWKKSILILISVIILLVPLSVNALVPLKGHDFLLQFQTNVSFYALLSIAVITSGR